MRKCFLLVSMLSFFLLKATESDLPAQDRSTKYRITGTVVEKGSGVPVYMATALIRELGLWAVADEKGNFELKNVPGGKFRIEFSILGYKTKTVPVTVDQASPPLRIEMEFDNLSLNEVLVVAKEGGEITSASKISRQTIEHIQPSSLKDVMQLLPGSVTQNPTLTTNNTLSIRDITGTNTANSAGTALVVDGASLSNDANLQMLANGNAINSGIANTASTAGGGVDVRQISTDNIESVEVVRGIPSVIYGDLTSGAVVVKTKAGITPWEIRLKADPQLKQIAFGKGFSMGERHGILNVSADYANAFSDIRTPSSAYNRVNLQLGYFNNFRKRVTLNVKLTGNYSNATNKSDPDLFLDEISTERRIGTRLNVNGKWRIDRPWITHVDYLLTGSVSEQFSRARTYQGSAGYVPVSTEMDNREAEGFFTRPQYYSDVRVYGLPVDINARITGNLSGRYGKTTNRFLLGVEWKLQGNSGRGKVFDPHRPPSPGSSSAFRERSYKEIPYLNRITGFIEDNFKFPIGKTKVEIQVGTRFNGIFAKNVPTGNFLRFEPRTNLKYTLLQQNTGFRHLSIRGGWGIAYKMPSMIYLYPEDTYKDMVSFSYNDFSTHNYGMTVLTTRKEETRNPDLKPQRSENIEAGLEFDTKILQGSIVYFNERLTDGYGFVTEFVPMTYRRFGYTWVNGEPSKSVHIGSGRRPVYTQGKVMLGTEELPFIQDTTFMALSRPVNNIANRKWGIEYTLDFAKIKALHTSISISGAYMNIRSLRNRAQMRLHAGGTDGRTFPYVGIYAGSASASNGSVHERLNANIRIITHIPRISMVVTLTAQMVFIDRSRFLCELDGASLPYYYNGDGERISGAAALQDAGHTKFVNPLYLMDRAGHILPFTQEMERDPRYRSLILSTNNDSYYIRQGYPFYGMLNLRITKEIKRFASVSFYANNFLNLRGRVRNDVTGYPSDRNTPIYFGAEVKINIR